MPRFLLAGLLVALCASSLSAQNCGWNGGSLALRASPQAIGKTVSYALEGLPGEPYYLFLSDGAAATPIPLVGTACLDPGAPSFQLFAQGVLSANGGASFPLAIPNDPALLSAPPLYAQALAGDPSLTSGLALSPGLAARFRSADGYAATAALGAPRALATATLGGDARVLIAGGGNGSLTSPSGTASTEIHDPFDGSTTPGPAMSVSRSLHTATRLHDGRILLCGGVIDGNGTVGSQCEIYDPVIGAFVAAASMNRPRAAHAAELLDDGRVLVVGGTTTFMGGSSSIGPVLNASLQSGEVYDPATNAWTVVANTMSSPRFLPTATRMNDGRVLVVSGLSGASSVFGQDVPTWTSSVDAYDPSQNRFVPEAGIGGANARAGASAIRTANGEVWIVGGAVAGFLIPVPTATDSTRIFGPGGWRAGPSLPQAAVLPPLVRLADESILVAGGIGGTLTAPTAIADVARLGPTGGLQILSPLPGGRGGHALVAMDDGNVLVAGGADAAATARSEAWIYTADL